MYQLFIILLVSRLSFGLICQEILELPEERKLSLYELQSLQPKEIVDCLAHLGREEMASDEADFIWKSVVQFFNGVANVPEEVLVSLHYVTVAVQPDDYFNITLGNIDVISNFGINYGLTDEQLGAIADRIREDFGAKQPEDYTYYDLVAMRQILCAFNRSEIERIQPKAYKEAAVAIGKLKKCNRDIMQGFAQLAIQETAFGSPSTWTNATLQVLGIVVEYLPNEYMGKLKTKLANF